MTNEYELTLKDAIKILKDSNKQRREENYTMAIYSAYVAKGLFERYHNKKGVIECLENITLSTPLLRRKLEKEAIQTLLELKEIPTLELVRGMIRASKTIFDLSDLLEENVEGSLSELIPWFRSLIYGDTTDSRTNFAFAYNRSN